MNAGRKRSFCKQEALDKAMRVFWENGYAGTSITHLTSALGINKPSLYAAFGNKEQLFTAAMEHYMQEYAAKNMDRLINPPEAPLRERLSAYLAGIIDVVCDCESPKGCMFVKSSCESESVAIPCEVQSALDDMGQANEVALSTMLEAEKARGQLAKDASVQKITSYLLSLTYGLTILAGRGKTKAELGAVASMGINALPGID